MSEPPNNYALSLNSGISRIGLVDDPADDPPEVTGSRSNSERCVHSDNTPPPVFNSNSTVLPSTVLQAEMM